jgi:hypothetical protein
MQDFLMFRLELHTVTARHCKVNVYLCLPTECKHFIVGCGICYSKSLQYLQTGAEGNSSEKNCSATVQLWPSKFLLASSTVLYMLYSISWTS